MRTVHVLAAVAGLLLAGCADDAPRQVAPGSSVPGSTSTTEQSASLDETVDASELLSVDDLSDVDVWAKQTVTWQQPAIRRLVKQGTSRELGNTETLGFLSVHSCPDPVDDEMELNLPSMLRDLNDVEAAGFSNAPWAPSNRLRPLGDHNLFIAVYADSATNIAAAYDEIVGVLDHCIQQPSLPGIWTLFKYAGYQSSLTLPSVGEASFGVEFGLDYDGREFCRHRLALVLHHNRLLVVVADAERREDEAFGLSASMSEAEFGFVVERSVEHLAV